MNTPTATPAPSTGVALPSTVHRLAELLEHAAGWIGHAVTAYGIGPADDDGHRGADLLHVAAVDVAPFHHDTYGPSLAVVLVGHVDRYSEAPGRPGHARRHTVEVRTNVHNVTRDHRGYPVNL